MLCGLQAKFNGTGKWEWEGNVYEGSFRDGYFHGNGTFLWSTGECFCGEFDTDCPKSGMLQQPQWGAQGYKASYDGATPLFASSKPHSLVPFDQLTPMSSGAVTGVSALPQHFICVHQQCTQSDQYRAMHCADGPSAPPDDDEIIVRGTPERTPNAAVTPTRRIGRTASPAKLTTSHVESREGRSAHRSPPRGGDREDRPSASVSPQRRPMRERLESSLSPHRRRQNKLSSNDLVSNTRSPRSARPTGTPKSGRGDSPQGRGLAARRPNGEMDRSAYTSLEALSSPRAKPGQAAPTSSSSSAVPSGHMLPRSAWQPNADADECSLQTCSNKFGYWYTRHHCRSCGRVVCSACSSRMVSVTCGLLVCKMFVDLHAGVHAGGPAAFEIQQDGRACGQETDRS